MVIRAHNSRCTLIAARFTFGWPSDQWTVGLGQWRSGLTARLDHYDPHQPRVDRPGVPVHPRRHRQCRRQAHRYPVCQGYHQAGRRQGSLAWSRPRAHPRHQPRHPGESLVGTENVKTAGCGCDSGIERLPAEKGMGRDGYAHRFGIPSRPSTYRPTPTHPLFLCSVCTPLTIHNSTPPLSAWFRSSSTGAPRRVSRSPAAPPSATGTSSYSAPSPSSSPPARLTPT